MTETASASSQTAANDPRLLEDRMLQLLLDGVPADAIAARLQGAASAAARHALATALAMIHAATERRRHARNHARWMWSVRRSLRPVVTVASLDTIAPDEFYERFYDLNRPVHLTSVRGYDPEEWSFERLSERYGNIEVEAMFEREPGKPDYVDQARHRRTLPLAEFIRLVQTSGRTNSFYLTSHNGALLGPLHHAVAAFAPLPGILHHPIGDASIWIGPEGAQTPLHYDRTNVLMIGLIGVKQVYLVPPEDEPFVAHDPATQTGGVSFFADAGVAPPATAFARVARRTLGAGEALLIPVGWWHAVVSDTPTCSISISSFRGERNYFPSNVF